MAGGHNSTKKRTRQGSSKERQGQSLLDFTNRQKSNQNIFSNINPYIFDSISTSKKAYKKKSESIDFV